MQQGKQQKCICAVLLTRAVNPDPGFCDFVYNKEIGSGSDNRVGAGIRIQRLYARIQSPRFNNYFLHTSF
jgi:hypothetical protein